MSGEAVSGRLMQRFLQNRQIMLVSHSFTAPSRRERDISEGSFLYRRYEEVALGIKNKIAKLRKGMHTSAVYHHPFTIHSLLLCGLPSILPCASRTLLCQRFNHLRDRERFCPVRFFVCGIGEGIEATEEPKLLQVTDESGDVLRSLDLQLLLLLLLATSPLLQ